MAAHGAFGTDLYDRSILRPKHRAYYRSDRPVIKIGPKGAQGSHEIRQIHSAPSLGQSIVLRFAVPRYIVIPMIPEVHWFQKSDFYKMYERMKMRWIWMYIRRMVVLSKKLKYNIKEYLRNSIILPGL